jgi:branched-chain amino acid transport system ATP-binding protein
MGTMSFSFEHVSKRFNGLAAIDDVSMRFEPGLIYAIIGPNGAGKSTLVNMAAGSYSVTSGSIVLDGTRLDRLKKYQISLAGIARTYQNIRLFDQMQVIENLEVCLFPDEARHIWQDVLMPGRARRRRAARLATCRTLLMQFGLADVEEQEARSLPYARQRMLEIARALVRQPKVLLLDEPAAGLNDAEMQELKDRLLRLRSDGLTIIVIEHNMNLVMSLSDHIYVLHNGALLFDGAPAEVRASAIVQEAYLGTQDELESIRELAQARKAGRGIRQQTDPVRHRP